MKHAGQGRPTPAVLEGEMLTPVSDTDAFHTQMSCTRNACPHRRARSSLGGDGAGLKDLRRKRCEQLCTSVS